MLLKINDMKKIISKSIAFTLTLLFVFNSLMEVNDHTYTIGVNNYHYTCGCFGCAPSHLSYKCNSTTSHYLF
jgi:hypothetical protein